MTARIYRSASAFKQALESRLRVSSHGGTGIARRRQLLIFDRFLARVTLEFGDAVALKGGLALELRLTRARTTKDVDLRLVGAASGLLLRLQAAASRDLGDFLAFSVRAHPRRPEMRGQALRYDGVRFRVSCHLAGKTYGRPFDVDVAIGDPIIGRPDVMETDDLLDFAGIAPPRILVVPVETHLAEKLHAYTMPRPVPNSRVKDLPDIALLASLGKLDSERLMEAIGRTFGFRDTHPVPRCLPRPPATWHAIYERMAIEESLIWPTLEAVSSAAGAFLDPALSEEVSGVWDETAWRWQGVPPVAGDWPIRGRAGPGEASSRRVVLA